MIAVSLKLDWLLFRLDPLFVAVTEEVTGRDASLVGEHGGSDGRYFTRKGIPVIMSRPNVGGLHSDREWIEIDSMLAYYHILDRYLRKKLGAEREPLSYVSEEGWGD
jgi:acetylornithine deacetylase/succinyl-diaminopimelate desuccinylase-like protein